MYYLTVSVSQESKCGLAGSLCSGSLISLQPRCWPRLQTSQGSDWVVPASNTTHMIIGRICFPAGSWTEGFSSSPVVPSILCHVGFSIGSSQHGSLLYPSRQAKRAIKNVSKMEVTVFCKLICEVAFHHFQLHSLCQMHYFQPTLQERGLHRA